MTAYCGSLFLPSAVRDVPDTANNVPGHVAQALDDYDTYVRLPKFSSLPVGTIAWVYIGGNIFQVERVANLLRGGRGLNLGHNARKVDGRRGYVYVMGNAFVEETR
jgi:hypothetical protein